MENNKEILHKNTECIEAGKYFANGKVVDMKLSSEKMQEAICFLPPDIYDFAFSLTGDGCPENHKTCKIYVENIDTLAAASKMYASCGDEKIAVLNFANPYVPGGGVEFGARAQEETLCLRSGLLLSLRSLNAESYYTYNKLQNVNAGSDAVILSPYVEVFRKTDYDFMEESVIVSVVSSAAPMCSPITMRLEDTSQNDMELLLYRRIVTILAVFIQYGYRRCVLGAYGCGVFCNDPEIVSGCFKKVFNDLHIEDYFDEICFAILANKDVHNFQVFERCFKDVGSSKK